MNEISQLAQDHVLRLSEEYSTPYNAIIREHIVMGVSRYFLERWVPVLGTAPATIVNTLRQLNYHTPDQPVTISGSALAREAAMSRRHLYTCMETPWLSAFIRVTSGKRARTQTGKVTQEANRYNIRMDDPLTLADAEYLMLQLKDTAKTPIAAAEIALRQPARELWAPTIHYESTYFHQPEPLTVKTVLDRAFPSWHASDTAEKIRYAQVAESLHRHVTLVRTDGRASKIIVPQYFRTRWWAHLGHDLAWSYLWLRGAVYDNPAEGVTRNTCWIPSLDTLLELIGRPREWWRRNVEQGKLRAGGWSPADFFEQLTLQKGRDPGNPQRVARQFLVRAEIPIAPPDRSTYSRMLVEWPENACVFNAGHEENESVENSTTSFNSEGVRHIQTQQQIDALPHLNTPTPGRSNTFRHAELLTLCHIQTQSSATSTHRESESLLKAPKEQEKFSNTKHIDPAKTQEIAGAAESKTPNENEKTTLRKLLSLALENTPDLALYQIGDIVLWLQQAWPEPIQPHTPAWTLATNGKIGMHDLVALMLAVWVDRTIKHPPRYLSWLLKQWKAKPHLPPVIHWPRWKKLAALPIGQWDTEGRREWIELTSSDNRALPFGLEEIIQLQQADSVNSSDSQLSITPSADYSDALPVQTRFDNEYDPNLEESESISLEKSSIHEIWRATMHQLSLKLHHSSYKSWVEGTSVVSFEDGILTIRASHFMAREQLSRRFNSIIEETVSGVAKTPVTVRYIL